MMVRVRVELEWKWFDLGVKNATDAKAELASQLQKIANLILTSNRQESQHIVEDDVTGLTLGRVLFQSHIKPEAT